MFADRLTAQMLRVTHATLFDCGFDEGDDAQPKYFLKADQGGYAEEGVGGMLFCERLNAASAFAEAQSLKHAAFDDVETYKDDLGDLYREYGLARGIKTTTELVHEVERQGQLMVHPLGR